MKYTPLLLLITLSACHHKAKTISHETGIVVEKQYTPEFNGRGSGITSKGDYHSTTIHDDEKYIVVFKCDHGVVFSMNRNDLYAKLNKGDTVSIAYYEILNSDNKIVDFDFVDANKMKY